MLIYRSSRRSAATIVEAAMVLSICLMFLFAIFEYGRFLFYLQLLENAAREGSRMAIAHTNDRMTSDVTSLVRSKLVGIDSHIENLNIQVEGMILRPKNASETAGTTLPDWTEASNTDGVSVLVAGDYRPILPGLLRMPTTIPIRARSVMYSEGN